MLIDDVLRVRNADMRLGKLGLCILDQSSRVVLSLYCLLDSRSMSLVLLCRSSHPGLLDLRPVQWVMSRIGISWLAASVKHSFPLI